MRHSGVILDMDGLMLDTEPFYKRAWQEAIRRLGHELSEELQTSLRWLEERDLVREGERRFALTDTGAALQEMLQRP